MKCRFYTAHVASLAQCAIRNLKLRVRQSSHRACHHVRNVEGVSILLTLLALLCHVAARAAPLAVTSETFTATVTLGDLSSLVDRAGNVFVTNNALNPAVIIHRVTGDHRATADEGPTTVGPGQRVVRTFGQFSDLTGASATGSYEVLAGSGDLIVTQACVSPSSGVWGVEWGIASVPLGMNIIVPGQSGIKLTRNMGSWTFDYPQGWESQLVIVEGAGRGFYVWAEDALGRYKRLTVRRAAEGWRLGFATLNVAPFDPLTNCASVKWHVNVYAFPKRICG